MKRLGSFTERYWIPRQHHARVIALCLIVISSFTEGTGTIPENFKKKHLRNIVPKEDEKNIASCFHITMF